MDTVIEANLNDNLAHYVDICIYMTHGSNTAARILQLDFDPFANIPFEAHENLVAQKQHNFNQRKPNFGWPTSETLLRTLKCTTQYTLG
jgi:hypothetical protein